MTDKPAGSEAAKPPPPPPPPRKLEWTDQLCIIWFIIDGLTHLTIEAGYLWVAMGPTAARSDSFMGFLWREYGRADHRWAVRDPGVISLELLTVVLFGPLCLWQAYNIYKRKSYRHILQIVICVAELYGGWMTFCPEWVEGNPNLNGSDPILFWIYLVFMNGLWVLVPLVLLWDSWAQLNSACVKAKMSATRRDHAEWAPSQLWYYIIAGTLILYCILIPAVLFTAKGVPVSKTPEVVATKTLWDSVQGLQQQGFQAFQNFQGFQGFQGFQNLNLGRFGL